MLRIVALISGQGSNLDALLHYLRDSDVAAEVVAIGSDTDAAGLALGDTWNIPTFVVPFEWDAGSSPKTREQWGARLGDAIESWQPDLLVLSGFMRVLPASAVARFAPRILNTHPAYLPEFPGAHAVRDALQAGVTETGASVIVVDESIDGGPIVARQRVAVKPGDTESTLHERIKVVERQLLADTIRNLVDKHVTTTSSPGGNS